MAAINGMPFDVYPYISRYADWSLLPYIHDLTSLTFLHLDYGTDEQRMRCYQTILEATGMDWLQVPEGPTRSERNRYVIEMENDIPVLSDKWSESRTVYNEPPAHHGVKSPKVASVRDVENLPPPLSAEELLDSGEFDITKMVVEAHGDSVFLVSTIHGPFADCYEMLGFDSLFEALMSQAALLHAILERRTEELIQRAKALKQVGVHSMRVWEIFSTADMISEEHYLRFAFPYAKRVIQAVREAGLVAIMEVLGWVEPRLPHLARLEMDAFQSDATMKGGQNRVAEYRKVLGEEVCIFGNINAFEVIERGGEVDWLRALEEQALGVGEQRRYCICGTPITWATSPARAKEFGQFARQTLASIAPPRGPMTR